MAVSWARRKGRFLSPRAGASRPFPSGQLVTAPLYRSRSTAERKPEESRILGPDRVEPSSSWSGHRRHGGRTAHAPTHGIGAMVTGRPPSERVPSTAPGRVGLLT